MRCQRHDTCIKKDVQEKAGEGGLGHGVELYIMKFHVTLEVNASPRSMPLALAVQGRLQGIG